MKAALLALALILQCWGGAHSQSQSPSSSPSASPTAETTTKSSTPDSAQPAASADIKYGKAALVLPPEKAQPLKLPRFTKPPVIDGKLDDEVWKGAVVLKDFYQVQPGD